MYYLVTTQTCPECPRAKSYLSDKSINVDFIDASTADGLMFARKHKVLKVPTLLQVEGDDIVETLTGYQEITANI